MTRPFSRKSLGPATERAGRYATLSSVTSVAATPAGFAPAMALLLVVVATDAWVYIDAKRQRDLGEPVVFTVGSLHIETPEARLVACIVLWIIAVPLYLTGRRR